jgi:kynurenine formamidase
VLESGANVNSIKAISDRVATRAVQVDIARMAGVEALEPGTPIGVEDIQRCLSGTNTQVRRGDILLVRTGFLQHCRQRQWKGYLGPAPGLTAATLPWIHEIGLAGVASDTSAVEVVPFSVPGVHAPFHVVGIVYMGLLVGEMFDLDQLAARCHDDGRYDFMLVAAPLPVSRAVGSPINPYGIR